MKLKERTERLIHSMMENRQKRRRRFALITALAMLTGGNVFYDLRSVGTAMTEDEICGIQAHEHTDSCYDDSGGLICGLAEHVHSSGCLSNMQADLETPEVWEFSFTSPENATRQEQAALIAESQLGYTESTENFILSEDGTKQGYTRYGDWYGNPYGEWNTLFSYFCLYFAGVTAEELPYGGNARSWQVKLKDSELILPPDSEPERGYVLLLDEDADGEADRTGIITGTEECLTVIEGDRENAVAEVQYAFYDPQIIGYVVIPGSDLDGSALCETAPEITYQTYSAESPSGIQVIASAEEGAFPEDTVMIVTDVSSEDVLQAAADKLDAEADSLDAVAVDISFYGSDGTELEPAEDKSVQVEINLPEEMKFGDGEYNLLHMSVEGDMQVVEGAEVSADGVVFETESFSVYIFVAGQYRSIDSLVMVNGQIQNGGNDADHPYEVHVGDTFEVFMDGYLHMQSGNSVVVNGTTQEIIHYIDDSRVQKSITVKDENYNDVVIPGWVATYRAVTPADCSIGDGTNLLYIRVVPNPNSSGSIMIKRQYDEKNKDGIKAYLPGYGLARTADGQNIPNSIGEPTSNGRPYVLRVGDCINVRSDLAGSFVVDGNILDADNPETVVLDGETYYVFKAKAPGNTKIVHQNGSTVNDEMYIKVLPVDQKFTHADMEIADGGIYTITEFIGNEVIVTEYDAFVDGIHDDTKICDKDGNVISEMPIEAYLRINEPPDPQYEVTSAYYSGNYPVGPLEGKQMWDTGHPNVEFNAAEADHVIFDVRLLLRPKRRYKLDANNQIIQSSIEDISNAGLPDEYIPSAIFSLGGQSVIDAMNKCPLTNGFDFTLRANGKMIKVPLSTTKTLQHPDPTQTLQDGQFSFKLSRVDSVDPQYSYSLVQNVGDNVVGNDEILTMAKKGYFFDQVYRIFYKDANWVTHWGEGIDGDAVIEQLTKNSKYSDCTTADAVFGKVFADPPDEVVIKVLCKYLTEDATPTTKTNSGYSVQSDGWFIKSFIGDQIVTNDAAGNVQFDTKFLQPGTYTYIMEEILPPEDQRNGLDYDTHKELVTITVSEDSDGFLRYSITYHNQETGEDANQPFGFKNVFPTYSLPSTGGHGALPYILGGTGLMGAALLLLLRKRRGDC